MATQSANVGGKWMQGAKRLAEALGLSGRDARSEVELLLSRALGISKARLLAHPELASDAQGDPRYLEYFERRLAGEPVAYILGRREFYGLEFLVTSDVLIPRPETELLVELALARIPEGEPRMVLDIGTGSGCVAIALAYLRPRARVIATDVSEKALEVARENANRHAVHIEFRLGDGFAPLPCARFDLIVSNPPYVAAGDPHLLEGDLRFEPKQALTAGAHGLDVLRPIVAHSPAHLREGGMLLLEHGYDQGEVIRTLLARSGFNGVFTERDLSGQPRVSGGHLQEATMR